MLFAFPFPDLGLMKILKRFGGGAMCQFVKMGGEVTRMFENSEIDILDEFDEFCVRIIPIRNKEMLDWLVSNRFCAASGGDYVEGDCVLTILLPGRYMQDVVE